MSVLLAGAAVGSLSGSGLANSLGRKMSLFLTAVPLLVGAVLSASAASLEAMLAGRAIAGVGIGLASALVPLYISEVRLHCKLGHLSWAPPLPRCGVRCPELTPGIPWFCMYILVSVVTG